MKSRTQRQGISGSREGKPCSFIMTGIVILALISWGTCFHPETSLAYQKEEGTEFRIAPLGVLADGPVGWVTAGAGLLAYGEGKDVYLAPEENPFSVISRLSFDDTISEGLILGRIAFLSEVGSGIRMLDLEDPFNPIDLGIYFLPGSTFRLGYWANFLLVGEDAQGVRILEFPPPKSPVGSSQITLKQKAIIPIGAPISAIAAGADGNLYVATEDSVIRVFDISDPLNPIEKAGLSVPFPVRSMAVNEERLFVAAGAQGIHVLDLSTPGNAGIPATHSFPSDSLYLAGRLAYSASREGGLHSLQVGPIAAATFDVQVQDFSFVPPTIVINAGDTVNWVWVNGGHTTTSGTTCTFNGPGPNTWNSLVNSSVNFSFTFNTPGSFPYFCIPHCFIGMTGTVSVMAVTPAINISVSPASVNFGSILVGGSSDQTITITNQASSTDTLTGNVGTPTAPFSVVSGGGAFSLTPGQSKQVVVRFSPSAEGPASANLSITHNATNQSSPISIPLNGTGVSTPTINLSVTPASVNFGSVAIGQPADQPITIMNQATSTSSLTGNVDSLSAPFAVVSGGGPFSLSPGQSRLVVIRFLPAAEGQASANLTITHNATNQGSPLLVPLSGTGVTSPMPDLVISSISGPSTATVGGSISISNAVMNQGTATAGASLIDFYLSTDTVITTGDIFLGKRSIQSLAAGGSDGPLDTLVKVKKNVIPGSYFIGAIVDSKNKVTESDEGNNTNFDPEGITICQFLKKPKPLAPKNKAANVSATALLDWSDVAGASSYEVQVATDSAFSNIVASMSDLLISEWTVAPALSSGTTYFWRARGVTPCGPGPWTKTFSFETL